VVWCFVARWPQRCGEGSGERDLRVGLYESRSVLPPSKSAANVARGSSPDANRPDYYGFVSIDAGTRSTEQATKDPGVTPGIDVV
jgi:hypothetical protein